MRSFEIYEDDLNEVTNTLKSLRTCINPNISLSVYTKIDKAIELLENNCWEIDNGTK